MTGGTAEEVEEVERHLTAHLQRHLGAWPPAQPLVVATGEASTKPGWDGRTRRFQGVRTPDGTVVSVPPDMVGAARRTGATFDEAKPGLERVLGARIFEGIYRWTTAPTPMDAAGVWMPAEDARVPEWLRPFGGEVLVALDDDERYLAGVGLKRHDDDAWEIAVGTEEAARGRGLARRLVTTAARRVLDEGRVVLYLHDPTNTASAHVADASGFPDRGWRILGSPG